MAAERIKLTPDQTRVMSRILDFLGSSDRVFILKGYAGTGKTTLLRFLIKELDRLNHNYRLVAPTGRAAKVMANISESAAGATTIHSMIYSFSGLDEEKLPQDTPAVDSTGQLLLNFEPVKIKHDYSTVYIIDESSMIADIEAKDPTQAKFGSGKLLTELMEYDANPASKYIFVGDPCQLPPVEQYFSPALMPEYFSQHFGVGVQQEQLTQIMRQDGDNDIVTASKRIRTLWSQAPESKEEYGARKLWGKLPFHNHSNIQFHSNKDQMVEHYVQSIKEDGLNHGVLICRSNKACNELSTTIRGMLGHHMGRIQEGDLLMVAQNNLLTGLVNGDLVVVNRVTDQMATMAGLRFRYIKVTDLANNNEYSSWIIEDILFQSLPNLDKVQQTALFTDFIVRMRKLGIKEKSDRFYKMMMDDPYLNALRCNYGYAVTCNKAQGGEWDEVYIDMPRNITLNPTKPDYQWVYTAMTRARQTLHLVDDFFYSN